MNRIEFYRTQATCEQKIREQKESCGQEKTCVSHSGLQQMENSPTTAYRKQRLVVDNLLGYEVVSAPTSQSLVPEFFDVFRTKSETDTKCIKKQSNIFLTPIYSRSGDKCSSH